MVKGNDSGWVRCPYKEINPILLMLCPLARIAPVDLLQRFAGKMGYAAAEMFAASDPAFIRAMCGFIRHWKGCAGSPGNVHRIHGRRGWIIRCPDIGSHVIDDGGHLIAMTHLRQCAAFIENIIEEV